MRNHVLVRPIIAAVVLGLALYFAGDCLADASQVKAACKSQAAKAEGNCPGSKAMAPCPSEGACCGVSKTPCQAGSAAACASRCETPCSAARADAACAAGAAKCSGTCCAQSCVTCGQGCGSVRHGRRDCSCGKTSCRLYGLRCGHHMNRASSLCCPSDCQKPCCAPAGVRKITLSKSGCAGAKAGFWPVCEAEMLKQGCATKLRIKTGDDGEGIWIEREDGDRDYVYEKSSDEGGAWLGVFVQDLSPSLRKAFDLPDDLEGALVTDVVRSGPARESGIREGFVVVGFNGEPVRSAEELVDMVEDSKPGEVVELTLNRKGERIQREVTLGESPSERIVIRATPEIEKEVQLKLKDLHIERPDIELEGMAPGMGLEGGFLGVSVEDLSTDQWKKYGDRGVLVTEVMKGTPAADVGLMNGDVILAIDDQDVIDPTDLVDAIRERRPGDVVVMDVVRSGETMKMEVELGGRGVAGSMISPIAPRSKAGAEANLMKLRQRIDELEKEVQSLKKQLKESERK